MSQIRSKVVAETILRDFELIDKHGSTLGASGVASAMVLVLINSLAEQITEDVDERREFVTTLSDWFGKH